MRTHAAAVHLRCSSAAVQPVPVRTQKQQVPQTFLQNHHWSAESLVAMPNDCTTTLWFSPVRIFSVFFVLFLLLCLFVSGWDSFLFVQQFCLFPGGGGGG